MKKAVKIIPLVILLGLYSSKAGGKSYVLPLPLNKNTIETINVFGAKGTEKNSYSFAFYSASKRSDHSVLVWGFKVSVESNIENHIEILNNLKSDYQTSVNSYNSIKTKIPDFVSKVDSLEAKINSLLFTEKVENVRSFVENWSNQLPLSMYYSYDKNNVEQFVEFVNTAGDIKEGYNNFVELSEFITDAKNNISDEEIKSLAYAADESRAILESSWENMSASTSRIYNQIIDKNLELPYAKNSFEVFIKKMFPFWGTWLMK